MQAVARGDLPRLPRLIDAHLLPLEKQSGGVRSIAVGEVWYRFVTRMSTCIQATVSRFLSYA
jgi:hypothetical protein